MTDEELITLTMATASIENAAKAFSMIAKHASAMAKSFEDMAVILREEINNSKTSVAMQKGDMLTTDVRTEEEIVDALCGIGEIYPAFADDMNVILSKREEVENGKTEER